MQTPDLLSPKRHIEVIPTRGSACFYKASCQILASYLPSDLWDWRPRLERGHRLCRQSWSSVCLQGLNLRAACGSASSAVWSRKTEISWSNKNKQKNPNVITFPETTSGFIERPVFCCSLWELSQIPPPPSRRQCPHLWPTTPDYQSTPPVNGRKREANNG